MRRITTFAVAILIALAMVAPAIPSVSAQNLAGDDCYRREREREARLRSGKAFHWEVLSGDPRALGKVENAAQAFVWFRSPAGINDMRRMCLSEDQIAKVLGAIVENGIATRKVKPGDFFEGPTTFSREGKVKPGPTVVDWRNAKSATGYFPKGITGKVPIVVGGPAFLKNGKPFEGCTNMTFKWMQPPEAFVPPLPPAVRVTPRPTLPPPVTVTPPPPVVVTPPPQPTPPPPPPVVMTPPPPMFNIKIGVMGKKDRIDHSNDWKVVRTGVVGGTPTFTNTDGKVPAGAFPAGKYLVWMSPVNRQGRPEGLGAVAAYVQNAEDESLRCWTIPVGFPVRKLEPAEVDPVRGADLCRFGCWGFLVELDWHKAVVFVNAVIGLDHEKGLKNLRRSCDS